MAESNIIIGAGLSGSIIANRIANILNEKVLVIDRRNHIGGNVYDYKDEETGITVQKYGPHIFHTNNKFVWDYLSQFTKWYNFSFEPNVVINGKAVTLPFNLTTISEVFEKDKANQLTQKLTDKYGYGVKIPILQLKNENDPDLVYLADFIYDNVFKNYTKKQWGKFPEEIDSSITSRVPIFISNDNRYFQDKYQGIPLDGYTKMVENILNHPNVEVCLDTDYKNIDRKFNRIIYTGSIDEFFNYIYGTLPYRSLDFKIQKESVEYYQKTAMTNYPNNYNYTRITEHKYFLDEKAQNTIISIEYPKEYVVNQNERYYPINNTENNLLYQKYKKEADEIRNLYFIGRLGEYKYYNMDTVVENALNFFEKELHK